MKNKLSDLKIAWYDFWYYHGFDKIAIMDKLRYFMGMINGIAIDNNKSHGVVKVHKWQIKLFKCVTCSDVYILNGMWRKLIEPKIAYGYPFFGMSENLYEEIGDILCKHYKWNEHTRYRTDDNAIRFDWMNYSPITIDCGRKNIIVWSTDDIRYLCGEVEDENGRKRFVLNWELMK
jgi:hypothetical protein